MLTFQEILKSQIFHQDDVEEELIDIAVGSAKIRVMLIPFRPAAFAGGFIWIVICTDIGRESLYAVASHTSYQFCPSEYCAENEATFRESTRDTACVCVGCWLPNN